MRLHADSVSLIEIAVNAVAGGGSKSRYDEGATRVLARVGEDRGIGSIFARHTVSEHIVSRNRICRSLLSRRNWRSFRRQVGAGRGGLVFLLLRRVHLQSFRSASMEGASMRCTSRPLTMERKLFQPAKMTWATCTPKKPRKLMVNQKCSQRAIS